MLYYLYGCANKRFKRVFSFFFFFYSGITASINSMA